MSIKTKQSLYIAAVAATPNWKQLLTLKKFKLNLQLILQ